MRKITGVLTKPNNQHFLIPFGTSIKFDCARSRDSRETPDIGWAIIRAVRMKNDVRIFASNVSQKFYRQNRGDRQESVLLRKDVHSVKPMIAG
jgi:hypothetical protein